MPLTIPDDLRAMMAPAAATLEPYDPAFFPVEVNLSANENAYGLPDEVSEHVATALAAVATNRYPSPLADDLRQAIAAWHGVSPQEVSVGNGGDELIFNLLLAFGGAGRRVVVCPPTFSVYGLYAELVGSRVVSVPRNPAGFALDEATLVTAARDAQLVIVCTPNNPTGNSCSSELLAAVADACPGVVLVDEAYVEFSALPSAARLLESHANVAVLHTLSKAFAFAGARLGYVLASTGVTAALAAVRQPYSVNAFTQAAAGVIVEHREAFEPVARRIVANRETLSARLAALGDRGVEVFASDTNFLLVRVPHAHRCWERLRDEHSVLVRDFSRTPGLADCLRVTVGTEEENERLVAGLAAILG